MNIGILTLHSGNNYGGVLQCYATQELLKNMGHNVEVIDYRPSLSISVIKRIINKLRTIKDIHTLIKVVKDIISVASQSHKKNMTFQTRRSLVKFDEFRTMYLHLSDTVNEGTIGVLSEKYDVIIVGSDQVWTSLYDTQAIYFLDWTPRFQGIRIGYAACSAHSFVSKRREKDLRNYLNCFHYISVRDQTTAKLVRQIIKKPVDIVADPTLLYNFRDFVTSDKYEPYILVYTLGSEIAGGHYDILKKIKMKYGNILVKSIIIPGTPDTIKKYSDEVLYNISPVEWVNLFAHASVVYTDSFHGIMFSIKFKKDFVAYYTNIVRSSRLIDLKNRFNLNNIIDNAEEFDLSTINVDYNQIEDYILYSKNKLREYLENSNAI